MLVALVALASGLSVTVDSLSIDNRRHIASAIARVTNSGTNAFESVYVNCAFLDASGRAVQVGGALVSNLAPGETAFGSADVDSSLVATPIASASCRIGMTQP
ncbi:FxLYD domain-containing protein [Mesorhizobium australicum]|uniref:FxLYD domain-containing protein n=1 Tax=Mesorhizobium australicum TaxID=536018 RepID=UPI00333B494B